MVIYAQLLFLSSKKAKYLFLHFTQTNHSIPAIKLKSYSISRGPNYCDNHAEAENLFWKLVKVFKKNHN